MSFLLIALACTENQIVAHPADPPAPEDTSVPEPLLPGIDVDASLDLGEVCDEANGVVTVHSTGDEELEIQDLVFEGAWGSDLELPAWVAPGDSLDIPVFGLGDGQVRIDSTAGSVEVALSATRIHSPELELEHPGDVLDDGVTTALTAHVLNAESVMWVSDRDGDLGSTPVVEGVAQLDWAGADRSEGTHTITAIAANTCGASSEELQICQQRAFYEEDTSLDEWVTSGHGFWDEDNEWIHLTQDYWQAGTVFNTHAMVDADAVDIQFRMYLGDRDAGADGISLTLLDASRMTGFVGSAGEGIGYAHLPGWTVEFDTWYNSHDPTYDDHVAFHGDGQHKTTDAWTPVANLEDDQWHDVRVTMDGQDLAVWLDGALVLEATVAIDTAFKGWIGFTSATGSERNLHLVDDLAVSTAACD